MDYLKENEQRDLWFKESVEGGWNCHFFPKDWAGEFQAQGTSDPDELYGYAPTHTHPNSPVYTMSVKAASLAQMTETTEDEARRLHPHLAAHLDAINANLDPEQAQA